MLHTTDYDMTESKLADFTMTSTYHPFMLQIDIPNEMHLNFKHNKLQEVLACPPDTI